MDLGDSFDRSQALSMDLLDTDVFFSTEQLGVGELDMAGLTDVDLANLDRDLDTKLGDPPPGDLGWGHESADLNLQPSDLVQFGDNEHSLDPESDPGEAGDQGCLDDDFQKMLSDWESHIGALSSSSTDAAAQETQLGLGPDPEPEAAISAVTVGAGVSVAQLPVRMSAARQLSLPGGAVSSLRSPVVPKPGVTYTRVAGLGPRVAATRISHIHHPASPASPPSLPIRSTKVSLSPSSSSSKDWFLSSTSSCPTATLPDNVKFSNCTVSDLSRTLENQKRRMQWLETNFNRSQVAGPGRGRHAAAASHQSSVKIIAAVSPGKNGQSTTRILSTRHDSLPRELIEKIKAASQGRKTIAIIEPINKSGQAAPGPVTAQSDTPATARPKAWLSSSQSKWRHVGIVNPLQTQNMSDHDYCSPTKTELQSKNIKTARSSSPAGKSPETVSSRGRDSGLESEGSDNSEDGGLYDKLPPYLTSVSVQTGGQEPDCHYSRVPYYMTTAPAQPQQQSLLKHSAQAQQQQVGAVAAVKQENVFCVTKVKTENYLDADSEAAVLPSEELRGQSSDRELEAVEAVEGRLGLKRSRSEAAAEQVAGSRAKYRRSNSRHKGKGRSGEAADNWRDTRRTQVEERKIVYVGKIEEGTLKADLRNRFQTFGPIVDVSIHFRERGDNYGFITFENKEDAYTAVEHGNDDPNLPQYDLCFGGRRSFCKEKYFDLDYTEEKNIMEDIDFDKLLEAARGGSSS